MNGFTGYQVYPETPWNYALDLSSPEDVQVLKKRDVKPQPWNNPDAPVVLGVKGRRLDAWKITDNMIDPVPASPVSCDSESEDLRLIPMGCTRLRICCFPTVKGKENDQ